ncbi:MAG: hypothetical protein JXB35_09650 [Anaerolineae bacterium]|nr:hypothetical protein [Anaerolineae bacterium]
MSRKSLHPLAAAALAAGTAATTALAVYMWVVRPWHRRWGAADDEVQRALPGDDRVPDPNFNTTRAITIHARPVHIWPWLLQMGQGRGGMYSYDVLENMMGLDIHTARQINPEWQDLKVGDVIALEPEGSGYTVVELQPERLLLLYTAGDDATAMGRAFKESRTATTWAFVLEPLDAERTRLIIRWRTRMDIIPRRWSRWALLNLAVGLSLDPIEFLMEHKMLRTLKERAEAHRAQSQE